MTTTPTAAARVSGTIKADARAALEELANMPLGIPLDDWCRLSSRILAAIQPDPEPEPVPLAWVDVKGFEESYEVSNEGDLRSKKTGKILAKHLAGSGYVKAEMWKNGERHQTYIHRLVADAFVLGDGDEVNHKNGIKTDNRSSNLEWCTRSENVKHCYYTLGYRIQAVTATNPDTGEVRNYRSVEESVRDGFDSANVYRAINNPGRRVKGFLFKKATPSIAGMVSVEEVKKMIDSLAPSIASHAQMRAALRALAGEGGR